MTHTFDSFIFFHELIIPEPSTGRKEKTEGGGGEREGSSEIEIY